MSSPAPLAGIPAPPATGIRRAAASALLGLLVLGPSLGGCVTAEPTGAVADLAAVPVDYHQRHPVVLADAPRTLDVFVGTGDKLDYRQKHDLEAFAAEFLARGQGRIRILVPRGAVDPRAADGALMAVRRGLSASGVRGAVEVGAYRAEEPHLASALRLSFLELQAGTAHPCGDWPEDLGPGSPAFEISNRPYYNLGCANQATLAAQVDDPRDLIRPRAEEPGDVYMRLRPIKDLRGDIGTDVATPRGQDPSTDWSQSNIVPIGSNR